MNPMQHDTGDLTEDHSTRRSHREITSHPEEKTMHATFQTGTRTAPEAPEAQSPQSAAATSAAERRPAVAEPCLTYRPNVDIRDCGSEVLLVIDMPGAKADGIDVAFEEGVVSVHAKVPPRSLPGRQVSQEYGIGDYRRSFRLGEGFDASLIAAEYRKGVLTVRVPRLAAVRPRKIEVRPA